MNLHIWLWITAVMAIKEKNVEISEKMSPGTKIFNLNEEYFANDKVRNFLKILGKL